MTATDHQSNGMNKPYLKQKRRLHGKPHDSCFTTEYKRNEKLNSKDVVPARCVLASLLFSLAPATPHANSGETFDLTLPSGGSSTREWKQDFQRESPSSIKAETPGVCSRVQSNSPRAQKCLWWSHAPLDTAISTRFHHGAVGRLNDGGAWSFPLISWFYETDNFRIKQQDHRSYCVLQCYMSPLDSPLAKLLPKT